MTTNLANRGVAITPTVTLVTEECCSCGIVFAMPKDFKQTCLEYREKKPFYCPNGHQQWYTGESDAELLRREKERATTLEARLRAAQARATHEADQRLAAERSARAHRAAHTRTKKRVAAGVCPCCKRHFADLGRHMAGQHPDYAPEGGGSHA